MYQSRLASVFVRSVSLNSSPMADTSKEETSLSVPTFVNLGFEAETDVPTDTNLAGGLGSDLEKQVAFVPSRTTSQPVTYSWENLEIFLDIPQGNLVSRIRKKTPSVQKKILDNVCGIVRPGEFLALMGSSGAGKTTLLNCLMFRNTGKLKIQGKRYINGSSVNTDSLARISGYVQQDDLFVPTFTVREHLEFHASLRMDKHLTYKERMDRVNEVINELGLKKCADAMIGNPERGVKGISGGERKRLAFASEVLTNPSLLFCDEPTSGLDSFMAQNIVQVMKNMASSGKAVICTIHQPSSEVFALFDRILLMAEGRTAFLGPVSEAMTFFESRGIPCPANYNPADFFIYTLATIPGRETETKAKSRAICEAYESSEYCQRVTEGIKANSAKSTSNAEALEVKRSPYKAGWFAQFRALFWRAVLSIIREPNVLHLKVAQAILLGGFFALVYQGQSLDFSSIQNIQGVLFLLLIMSTFQNTLASIPAICAELPIFLREHLNGMYRTDVYFLTKSIAELPLVIFLPVIFTGITYYVIGLNPAVERFFMACGIVALTAIASGSFGYLVSCMSDSTDMGLALSAPLIVPLMLFGGFFLQTGTAPVYLEWIRYISWFTYANEALTINQWDGIVINDELPICRRGFCTGDLVINFFNYDTDNFLFDLILLSVLALAYRIVAFLFLLLRTYRKK